MQALKDRILAEGKNLGGGILKVDHFINHQVDPQLMNACGEELARRFATCGATRILTAEISGIAPALMTGLHMNLPVVYARKSKPITMPDQVYLTIAPSHTRGRPTELIVSPEFLGRSEKVLIIDDFLASGSTILGLVRLTQAAGASLVGVGALIEKTFEGGRDALGYLGVQIEALVSVVIDDRREDRSGPMTDSIAILDFGSQYSQLIARRVRETQVYCELFPWDAPAEKVLAIAPRGFILSGGPASVYEEGAPYLPAYVLESHLPVLGICYGMQALTLVLGGVVAAAGEREYGPAEIETVLDNPLLPPGRQPVWMSHGDRIERQPAGFSVLARSANSPVAAIGDPQRGLYGVQFHPEVQHTPGGAEILRRFVRVVCACQAEWTPESIIAQSVERICLQTGGQPILSAVSGGVDSSVATALVQKAAGDQLHAVFVDTGLLRKGEREQVEAAFRRSLGERLAVVDASETFLSALRGVTDPEQKRKIIGETFIRVFEQEALRAGSPHFLVQGTIYPDVIEFGRPGARQGPTHQVASQRGRPARGPVLRTGRAAALFIQGRGAQRGRGPGLARRTGLAATLPRPRPGGALPGRDHRRAPGNPARRGCHFHR